MPLPQEAWAGLNFGLGSGGGGGAGVSVFQLHTCLKSGPAAGRETYTSAIFVVIYNFFFRYVALTGGVRSQSG